VQVSTNRRRATLGNHRQDRIASGLENHLDASTSSDQASALAGCNFIAADDQNRLTGQLQKKRVVTVLRLDVRNIHGPKHNGVTAPEGNTCWLQLYS
jgi:hypothetical protein